MIRPFTCICMLLAGAAGLYLYQSKHQAQLLNREIGHTVKLAELARERAGVLRAEYTRLNDPQRLAELANDHLPGLKSTMPGQFTTWAELEKRLPPVGAPAAEAAPLEPEAPAAKLPEAKPDAAKSPEAKPDAAKPIAAAHPATGGAPVVATAASATLAHPPAQAPAPRPAIAPVSLTASLQTPPARPVTVAAIAGRPAPPRSRPIDPQSSGGSGSSSGEPAPRLAHAGASESPVSTVAATSVGSPVAASPAMASSLGMARSMAPPPQVTRASAAAVWRPDGNYQQ